MFSFGVISDVQYADCDDALPEYPPFRKRYYRGSLQLLRQAICDFNRAGAVFMLQLGDLLDGKCKPNSDKALNTVMDIIKDGGLTTHHTLGNHDLYNFKHGVAVEKIINSVEPIAQPDKAYYSFVHEQVKFINLDSYDMAILGRDPSEVAHQESKLYVDANPNSDKNSPTGLKGHDRRLLMYNGGLGPGQMSWLHDELTQADAAGQSVVVFAHCGISLLNSPVETLLWNYEEVEDLLESFNCVKLVFSGHSHMYRHGMSANGKHYITVRAALETPADEKSWIVVDCLPTYIKVDAPTGFGFNDDFVISL